MTGRQAPGRAQYGQCQVPVATKRQKTHLLFKLCWGVQIGWPSYFSQTPDI